MKFCRKIHAVFSNFNNTILVIHSLIARFRSKKHDANSTGTYILLLVFCRTRSHLSRFGCGLASTIASSIFFGEVLFLDNLLREESLMARFNASGMQYAMRMP